MVAIGGLNGNALASGAVSSASVPVRKPNPHLNKPIRLHVPLLHPTNLICRKRF